MKLEVRNQWKFVVAALGAFAFGGCQGTSSDAVEIVAVEANDLGVTHVEIEHRADGADRWLDVRGIGASGEAIASVTVRTGMVTYSMEPGVSPDVRVAGTELDLVAGDARLDFVNPDRAAHQLPEPDHAVLGGFVRLTAVSSAIASESAIRFTRHDAAGEVAFAAGACSAANFPTSSGSSSSCCQDGSNIWHKAGSLSSSANKLASRSLGAACTTQAGAIGCTSDCWFGPCAAHAFGTTGTTAAAVFIPTSQPTVCGRDDNGTAAGGSPTPEAYTGAQTLWSGITPTCARSICSSDGNAGAYLLTVSSFVSNGDGTVVSSPAGIQIDSGNTGIGDDSAYDSGQVVQLTADPAGSNSQASFSGACSNTGAYGQTIFCNVTMSSAKSVTVTFACRAGFTCPML